MMDAAKAAAENGLNVLLRPTGEIEFTSERARNSISSSPEDALKGWLNGNKVGGRA